MKLSAAGSKINFRNIGISTVNGDVKTYVTGKYLGPLAGAHADIAKTWSLARLTISFHDGSLFEKRVSAKSLRAIRADVARFNQIAR